MKFYILLGLLSKLDNLNLEELIEIKQNIDELIQSKTSLSQDTNILASSINQMNSQNDMQALDSMIELVDKWLQDDSKYDKEVYSLIEDGLIQN
ncbi:hypothetical protein NIES4071_78610 [Calothrix sp. NIES-4071]|nr:hypothetical protein NIES4071_78610 [Calothrix sp. NIES-4071]BAZ62133.1 hypothetical protein NIES4105_78540 [Calothrix sp. NIES-4105]